MAIESRNPFNNELIKSFKEETDHQILRKIELAQETYLDWKSTNFTHRKALMLKTAVLLRDRKVQYAHLITQEMGKAKREAIAEIEKCALACDYYAENAEQFLSNKKLEVPEGEAYVAHDPIGIVLAVMPWNFPFWQVFRFVAPNLMAGNVGLLKHASNVPQCALAIEEVLTDAGFPKGCFQTLLVSSSKVNMILDDERVKAATLTGSEGAGSKVAERAGRNLKKTVLELGGSDPFIVLKDADIKEAAITGAKARMINNGQSCIAAKRFILEKSIADEFLAYFKTEFENIKIGDPSDDHVDYGSMAREDLAKELEEQMEESVKKGAKILIGGKRNKAFYEPTILTNVKTGMPAYEEELFGPVAVVLIAENENHAVELANDSRFGLGGSLWSQDIDKAKSLVRHIESGAIYINKLMASHPAVPFGGVKMSGFGRELSELGIKEFVNQKTIWVA
jgi:succinate-semialdehyde dehydrogenase/glutarate-semialdehyde dehydrogenase